MSRIIKAVGAGIGLATEAYAAKQKSQPSVPQSSSSAAAPEYCENDDNSDQDEIPEKVKLQDDEVLLELDEAQPPAYTPETAIRDGVDQLVQNFQIQHPSIPATRPQQQLASPVILPQRRPENRQRGFIRAYAPSLDDCGIDQQTFLDFLDSFDKSIEVGFLVCLKIYA